MLIDELEGRVEMLYQFRHDYPIWPEGTGPFDFYEHELHDDVRHTYYKTTRLIIHILRELKTL